MDEDDDPKPPRHWGDYGALLLAGGFSLFGFYLAVTMALGGHPLAVLFRKQAGPVAAAPRPLSDEEARQLPFHAGKGEVVIMTNHPPKIFEAADPFPAIKDWSSLRITLERSACLGSCPSYAVQVAGDGQVFYRGMACVAQMGERRARISRTEVEALAARFKDVGYFALAGRYAASITDQPTYRTAIRYDGRSKAIVDYAGAMAGMPKAMSALEDAIDKAAGTARWVQGDAPDCRGETRRP